MRLELRTEFKGIPLNAYYKITQVSYNETGKDITGKLYTMDLQVNSYTNATKEFDIEQKVYSFKDLRLADCTIDNGYILLKEEKDFEGFLDA